MGYALRMSAETHDWLTGLRDGDPAGARSVAEALTALMEEGASLGPPLVVALPEARADLARDLDRSYQQALEWIQVTRGRAAAAAGVAERLRRQVAALGSLEARLAGQRQRALDAGQQDVAAQVARDQAEAAGQLGALRQRLAEVTETEQRLAAEAIRGQRRVDAFRARKEVLKASLTSALAEVAISGAAERLGGFGVTVRVGDHDDHNSGEPASGAGAGGPGGKGQDGRGEGQEGRGEAGGTTGERSGTTGERSSTTGEGSGVTGGEGTGGPDPEASAAADGLREVEQEIERELSGAPWAADGGRAGAAADGGLAELRPGAPEPGDTRILFAVEPPGSALLLAVLEGRDALREHYDEAVALSSEVLGLVRAGQAPEATAHAFEDAQSFLDEFFAGEASEVEAGAAFLATRNRARTLAELRDRLGLSQAEVAARMGVRVSRVAAIERAQPGATEVRALARYVEALGGRLEVAADVGGERVILR